MKTTAELLAAYKAAQDINDTELGARLGIGQSTASSWVSGRVVPADDYLPAIARVLKLPVDEVRAATVYARRLKVESIQEALVVVNQLQAEVRALRSEVAELRSLVQPPSEPGRRKRQG